MYPDMVYDEEMITSPLLTFVPMVFMLMGLAAVSQQQVAATGRLPVLYLTPEAIAANVGLAWIEPQVNGPSMVRVVIENSTGAFEIVLLGLST